MRMLKNIWHMSGSIQLTFYLIILTMADFAAGFFSLKSHSELFHPLNDLGFVKWAGTYARNNPSETAWLFILIGLMATLSINTFTCTTERVITLFRQHAATDAKTKFILRLSPHIMHYALLIMLLGYLVSYLTGDTYLSNVLIPGGSVKIPGTIYTVKLTDLEIDYYQGNRLSYMQDRGIGVRADILIQHGNKSMTGILSVNKPVRFRSYSLHLRDFSPKSKSGMSTKKYIEFNIKKDPGSYFYFGGMILFTAGLLLYLLNWLLTIKQK